VCATNRDLKGEVAAGRFRKDLFFRVNGVKVVIPPLRERPEDIPLLVEHFTKQLPNQKRFTPGALAALSEYDWPGNVRELHFAVERAGLLAEGEMIDLADLPPEIVEKTGRVPVSSAATPSVAAQAAPARADDDDDDADDGPGLARVRAALEKAKWRREKAAEILGVSPRTLYRWIKRLGL
jgi:DNA-binding NtrC family response regulator